MSFESNKPCVACRHDLPGETCYHHLYTKKAWPQFKDESWNLISVCRKCHNEFHSLGTNYMSKKKRAVENWLIHNGWYICETQNRWKHD